MAEVQTQPLSYRCVLESTKASCRPWPQLSDPASQQAGHWHAIYVLLLGYSMNKSGQRRIDLTSPTELDAALSRKQARSLLVADVQGISAVPQTLCSCAAQAASR